MELIQILLSLIDSKNKWIEKENKRATADGPKEEFTLYYAWSYRVGVILSLGLVFLFVSSILILENVGQIPRLIAGALFIASVFYIISCFKWKLTYDKFFIEYQPGFGAAKRFQYNELRNIKLKDEYYILKTDDTTIIIDKKIIGHDLLLEKLKRHFRKQGEL